MTKRAGLAARRAPAPGFILAVASAGPLLVLFAFTVPLTTLTSTAASLQAGPGAQAWILSAMSVGAAAGLMSSGAIGDDYGRRRTFLAGLLLLAGSSVLGALAPTALVLIIARILQGLGGAAILACSLGAIGHAFPDGPERGRATAVWAAALGAGVAIGPILSAGLDMLGGWPLPYVVTALAAAALAVAVGTVLPESRADKPRPIDLAGTLLLGLGLAALLAGLTEARRGWGPLVLVLLLVGLALLARFVAVERRMADPMLDLALFRRPAFVGATVAALAAGAGVLSLMSLIPTLVERAMGISALLAAILLLTWSATTVVTALGAPWLPPGMSPRVQLAAGLLGCAAGQLALFGLTPDSPIARLLPGLAIAGAANGVLNAALGRQAVDSVPADRAAMGSGANNTARYLGSAIGLTVVTVLMTHAGAAAGAAGLVSGWNIAVLVTTGFSLAGALVVFLARGRRAGQTGSITREQGAKCEKKVLSRNQEERCTMKKETKIKTVVAATVSLFIMGVAPAYAQNAKISPNGSRPSMMGAPENFTGTVIVDPLYRENEHLPQTGGLVTFAPGARSAWHTHPAGQILIVTSGTGWVQEEGGEKHEIKPGDMIWTPPGVKHWHGATATTSMSHLAITNMVDGVNVNWMEKVSDEQYRG